MTGCSVKGCSARTEREKVRLFRIPKVITNQGDQCEELSRRRRSEYLSKLYLKTLDADGARVCSRHFISGQPAALYDQTNPDWTPSLHLGHSYVQEGNLAQAQGRHARRIARAHGSAAEAHSTAIPEGEVPSDDPAAEAPVLPAPVLPAPVWDIGFGSDTEPEEVMDEEALPLVAVVDASTQTDVGSAELAFMHRSTATYVAEIEQLRSSSSLFKEDALGNDEDVRFYTGLPSLRILKAVFELVSRGLPATYHRKLSPFQEMMIALMKLRMDFPIHDLAYRFGVSKGTVSRILHRWYVVLDTSLRHLLHWPEREELQKTMPACFRESFGKTVVVIIDCFEVFINRPSNLMARAQTWSNYKHHNTIKVLIGCTPQGSVSFVSEPWGGRVSDKRLTEASGLLAHLLPGDVVLADRGFDIDESVAMTGARLHIPAFTRGKKQLPASAVHDTRGIANVRIHIERVIGCVRQKYTILSGTLPIEFLKGMSKDELPLIYHMLPVCCALTNLCDSVVPFD